MTAAGPLLGRGDEQRRLAALVAGARNGNGAALTVVGEPGIGKTALLAQTTRGPGVLTVRLDGFESESSIPFAAVQRLVAHLRGHLPELRERQRDALSVASGMADGPAPDRFLVGLGLLSLLAAAGSDQPVVCAVDDAHLIDAESLDVLAFVARRLAVERVGLVFAARDAEGVVERLAGVPQLVLEGLDVESATRLLRRSCPQPLTPAAAAAIVRATGGNPLALIDLAEDLSAGRVTDAELGDLPAPMGHHLERHYARRVRLTDPATQEWVLLAAAEPTGSAELVMAAAAALGLDPAGGDRAEAAGLLALQPSIRFRHPLVRAAAYNAVSGGQRRRAHRALAEAAGRLGLDEPEAWHASRAALGTDPAVADRLAHAADLAAQRGGLASRATILARSAELTPPGALRDERRVEAAEAALAVGAAHIARQLVDRVDDAAADPVTRGRAIVVRSALTMFTGEATAVQHGAADHLRAADAFHGRDAGREQEALLTAFERSVNADRLMTGMTPAELGRRLSAGARLRPGPVSEILHGLGALVNDPYEQAVPTARRALDAILALPDEEMMRMGSAMASIATFLWDERGRADALQRAAQAARDLGALQVLDTLLWVMALADLWGGTVRRAVACDQLVRDVRRAMGYDAENVINVALMAWTGAPREVVTAVADGARAMGFGGVAASGVASLAVRDLADGAYRDAYERLGPLVADPFLQVTPTQYPDYVEAAARSGHQDEAVRVARLLDRMAAANGSAWCRGVALRSLALAERDEAAERYHAGSVEALGATGAQTDLARSHLVYGEWLRRAKRRREAAEQLHLALGLFRSSGAELFVARTVAELDAVGSRTDPAATDQWSVLTPQELTVARQAAAGRTNSEIAANLFISPNTVDYHLRKVFQKLGVSSRRQLVDRLGPRAR